MAGALREESWSGTSLGPGPLSSWVCGVVAVHPEVPGSPAPGRREYPGRVWLPLDSVQLVLQCSPGPFPGLRGPSGNDQVRPADPGSDSDERVTCPAPVGRTISTSPGVSICLSAGALPTGACLTSENHCVSLCSFFASMHHSQAAIIGSSLRLCNSSLPAEWTWCEPFIREAFFRLSRIICSFVSVDCFRFFFFWNVHSES